MMKKAISLGAVVLVVVHERSDADGGRAFDARAARELRKKIEEQLKKGKPGQPTAPEKLKGLAEQLESRVKSQLKKKEEERPQSVAE